KRNRVAFDFVGPARHVAEHVGGERNVRDARDRERLAVVERFELRELLGVFFDEVPELPNHAAALGRRKLAPWAGVERGARRRDRAVDVFFVAFRDVRKHIAGRGIVCGERFSGSGVNPLAVDQHLPFFCDVTRYTLGKLYCLRGCGHLFSSFSFLNRISVRYSDLDVAPQLARRSPGGTLARQILGLSSLPNFASPVLLRGTTFG